MIVGFDYWQVISHYPEEIGRLIYLINAECDVYIISAIGKQRIGTIAGNVQSHYPNFNSDHIHEVVFENSRQSPELKLAKCKELGVDMFFDDRRDVCELLSANGILAFQVPRKELSTDIGGERE